MSARFLINRTFTLPGRMLYVMEGTIIAGTVAPGMNITIGFNDSFSMEFPIASVEFVRRAERLEREFVALAVSCEDAEELEFLDPLWLSNDEVLISVPVENSL